MQLLIYFLTLHENECSLLIQVRKKKCSLYKSILSPRERTLMLAHSLQYREKTLTEIYPFSELYIE